MSLSPHFPGDAESMGGGKHNRHNLTATIGLVFHAAGKYKVV